MWNRQILATLLVGLPAFCQQSALLPQRPAFNGADIVFSMAGDLWRVSKSGGRAQRLTTGAGMETYPVFSPDGKTLAFCGEYDGNFDVYTMPVSGGVPMRLTWHPNIDEPAAWTPDGAKVVFRSARGPQAREKHLYAVPAAGGPSELLPLGAAVAGSYSPDGARLAYMPIGFFRPAHSYDAWKGYRGGRTTKIWLADLKDSSTVEIPRDNSNDADPMWIGRDIFFLSDREGKATLFAYDEPAKKVRRDNTGLDYKSASAGVASGAGTIALERFGALELYDVKSKKLTLIPLTVESDIAEVRPRLEKAESQIQSYAISTTGKRALFEARGEILSVPAEKGDVRVLTNTPGAHERAPAWSRDGKHLAWFSDASGEYALIIASEDGASRRTIAMDEKPGYYFDPVWSPDSKWIVCENNRLQLLLVNVESGKVTVIGTDTYYDPERSFDPSWSPDSKWIAYTRELPSHFRAVFVHSLADSQSLQITDGMSDARFAAFDAGGEYLYFTASTNSGPTLGWIDMNSDPFSVTRSAYVVALRKDAPSPLGPESDEEKKPEEPKKQAGTRIDIDGLGQRILALPVPPKDYRSLQAGKAGVLFLAEAGPDGGPGTVQKFELKTRKATPWAEGVTAFAVSSDGEKALYRKGAQWAIAPTAAAAKPGEGALKTADMQVWVSPREEWAQIYREAWRMQREYLYDPNLHGVDWRATAERYQKFVAGLGSRADLNYLITEMLGHIGIGHLYIRGGAVPEGKPVPAGMLGADFEAVNGKYRIAKIYGGENWNPALQAPLTQPGVDARVGDFVLEVDGRPVTADREIHAFLEARAGKQVRLKLSADPAGASSREVIVKPVPNETGLRYYDWVESNRRKVDAASGGRLAYVYMPDTGRGGYSSFIRYYFAQSGKEGVIIDERFNGGGQAADYVIDVLRREPMNYWRTRYGNDITTPVMGIFGPRVMIVNEFAGSGGDAMPYYFRFHKLGKLVGTRTWGGLVGILGFPSLMDGGSLTAPNFAFRNLAGEFDVENKGVAPDVEVKMDPAQVSQGRDPQLEKAIAVALEELAKNPRKKPAEPAYPRYNP
jgi:tricorn protease